MGRVYAVDVFPARIGGSAAKLRRHGGRRVTDSPTERGAESTWARLRRRKVVQWGVAYAAGAWLLMQVLEYFSGTFDWPRQVQQLSTLALLIGLPIVLVLAWYHGDRGEQRIRGAELSIVALLLLLGAASSGTTSTLWRPRRLPLRLHRAHLRFRPMPRSRFCPSPT